MKRPGKVGAVIGAIAFALAIAGSALMTVNAQESTSGPGTNPVQKTDEQGVNIVNLGF